MDKVFYWISLFLLSFGVMGFLSPDQDDFVYHFSQNSPYNMYRDIFGDELTDSCKDSKAPEPNCTTEEDWGSASTIDIPASKANISIRWCPKVIRNCTKIKNMYFKVDIDLRETLDNFAYRVQIHIPSFDDFIYDKTYDSCDEFFNKTIGQPTNISCLQHACSIQILKKSLNIIHQSPPIILPAGSYMVNLYKVNKQANTSALLLKGWFDFGL